MRRIPLIVKVDVDALLHEKARELAERTTLPLWYVTNVLRWRRARGLPVFQLHPSERDISVPCRIHHPHDQQGHRLPCVMLMR